MHGVVRWRLCDLCGWLHETYGVTLSETRLGQIIRREGFRLLTARPRHYRQDTQAQDIFKRAPRCHGGNHVQTSRKRYRNLVG
ncbi:hypothetical protein AAJCM20276_22610 [Acetobacter aceti]|uniref:Winged helix-turn helix domain-containing protein n=1 Tax=Acetobacter aceti TaxID=435 RepID=A0A6S6PFA4_ACEAC|nr:hypothetical protein AAJCM20276_22610 [Acetobacter aceti]